MSRSSQQESSSHDHTFGEHLRKPGEPRTLVVVLLTAATMILEIAAGITFGSMALLADGLHMASHATALAISMFAYIYARRHAHDKRFSFGTGKVNSLAGFTGAVLLAIFALIMVSESVKRLFLPITIEFDHALVVACIGLIVNGLSVVILGHPGAHRHDGGHGDDDAHEHTPDDHHAHDHNLRSAYLHVLSRYVDFGPGHPGTFGWKTRWPYLAGPGYGCGGGHPRRTLVDRAGAYNQSRVAGPTRTGTRVRGYPLSRRGNGRHDGH